MERIAYGGWPNNLRLANADCELVLTLDVGPRLLVYRPPGGANVFKEFADQLGGTGEPRWMIRGGHRLWIGPEDTTRTYAPDNAPVAHLELGPLAVRLTQPPDAPYGVQKEMDVALAPAGTRVDVLHRVTNVGRSPTTLAVWTLSVMAGGGTAVVPLPPKRPHPGPPENATTPDAYAPNQRLVLWPFFDFADPRWTFGSRYLRLTHDATRGPTKIGLRHALGGVAYLNRGVLFVKRFGLPPGDAYPDDGVNFELFANEHVVELEGLGPLTTLAPGASVEWAEQLELIPVTGDAATEDDLDRVLPAGVWGGPR